MRNDQLPEEIENFRDHFWRREPSVQIENVIAAEGFVDRVGFCSALTDSRRPGPSLYIAVCGRRDAHAPRNVQKDPEMRLAWNIKDELLRRGRLYYGKLRGNRSIFITRGLIPHFNTLFGMGRAQESTVLSEPAQNLLRALRKEWELSTGDLRRASRVRERPTFNKALDELQRAFKVLPSDVIYDPKFTYIWTTVESRFRDELKVTTTREDSLKEIARAYLSTAGMTWRGELARVTGLSNTEAGMGNWALVDEGFATRVAPGVYRLTNLKNWLP